MWIGIFKATRPMQYYVGYKLSEHSIYVEMTI